MKKHVAGFALFCFTVTLAVFVNIIFKNFVPSNGMSHCDIIKAYPKTETAIESTAKKSPLIRQATFNLRTTQLDVEMLFGKDVDTSEKNYVRLNFFKYDGKSAKYIISETFVFLPESYEHKNKEKSAFVISSYYWLDNLQSYENLYVTAEYVEKMDVGDYDKSSVRKSEADSPKPVMPEFDAGSAKEVLLFRSDSANDVPDFQPKTEIDEADIVY